MLKRYLVIFVLFSSFIFVACENGNDSVSNSTNPPQIAISKDIAINEAQNIAALSINASNHAIQDYKVLSEQENGFAKVDADAIHRYDPVSKWHTWSRTISGEALEGYSIRGQQYVNIRSDVNTRTWRASGIRMYYISEGQYGYVDGSPAGTSWLHKIGSPDDPVMTTIVNNTYVFTGTGLYNKTWDGYYKANEEDEYELVRISTDVKIDIDQLTAGVDAEGNRINALFGNMYFNFAGWTVDLACDGSDTITGVMKYNGAFITNLEYSVIDLIAMAQSL
jgi:hypothetical protein